LWDDKIMAEFDAELRAAIVESFRVWFSRMEESSLFARRAREKEGFEQSVDRLLSDNDRRQFTEGFGMFHDKLGRYPTFEEVCPPDGPVIGIVPGIE
jgi:hypothetical protein